MNIKRSTAAALAVLLLTACSTQPAGTDATACATFAEIHNNYFDWITSNRSTVSATKHAEYFVEVLDKVTAARKTADSQEIRDAMIATEQALQAINEPRFFIESRHVAQACENAGAPIRLSE